MKAYTCIGCGERIIFAVTRAGNRQPLNRAPDDAGNVAAHQDALGAWHARTLRAGEEPDRGLTERRYMPHAATCTATKHHPATPSFPDNVVPLRRNRG